MNTITYQFSSFFTSVKDFFINLYNTIHNFLNNYMDDTAIGIFAIIFVAGIVLFIFRRINHD